MTFSNNDHQVASYPIWWTYKTFEAYELQIQSGEDDTPLGDGITGIQSTIAEIHLEEEDVENARGDRNAKLVSKKKKDQLGSPQLWAPYVHYGV
jgi:hypothetical protein